MTMAAKSRTRKASPALQYVAIGQIAPDGTPESLNTFDNVKDAAACAGEFVANHQFPCAAWVETIAVRPFTKETKQ